MRNHFRSQLNIFLLPSATLVAGLRIFSEFAAPLLAISELKVFDFKCSMKEEIYVGFIKSPCCVLLKSKLLWRLRQQTDIFVLLFILVRLLCGHFLSHCPVSVPVPSWWVSLIWLIQDSSDRAELGSSKCRHWDPSHTLPSTGRCFMHEAWVESRQ